MKFSHLVGNIMGSLAPTALVSAALVTAGILAGPVGWGLLAAWGTVSLGLAINSAIKSSDDKGFFQGVGNGLSKGLRTFVAGGLSVGILVAAAVDVFNVMEAGDSNSKSATMGYGRFLLNFAITPGWDFFDEPKTKSTEKVSKADNQMTVPDTHPYGQSPKNTTTGCAKQLEINLNKDMYATKNDPGNPGIVNPKKHEQLTLLKNPAQNPENNKNNPPRKNEYGRHFRP